MQRAACLVHEAPRHDRGGSLPEIVPCGGLIDEAAREHEAVAPQVADAEDQLIGATDEVEALADHGLGQEQVAHLAVRHESRDTERETARPHAAK